MWTMLILDKASPEPCCSSVVETFNLLREIRDVRHEKHRAVIAYIARLGTVKQSYTDPVEGVKVKFLF